MSVSSINKSQTTTFPLITYGDIAVHSGTSNIAFPAATQNGNVLISSSSSVYGLRWGIGQTQSTSITEPIAYSSITANTNTVTISNIPQTGRDLRVIVQARNTSNNYINIRFSGITTASYHYKFFGASGNTVSYRSGAARTSFITDDYLVNANLTSPTDSFGVVEIFIPEYASGKNKVCQIRYSSAYGATTLNGHCGIGYFNNAGSISSINVIGQSLAANSNIQLIITK